jgi:2-C-methyl-D-erythritol 4-phosphate cytidylyltransferase
MAAIVPAAGCGARTGLSQNKILAPLCDRPLLGWTLQVLAASAAPLRELNIELTQILVAARREEFAILEELFSSFSHFSPAVVLVEGGATRQESVGNAARKAEADFLLVHDAGRPLLTHDLVCRVADAALQKNAALAALPASDTVKVAREKDDVVLVADTLKREMVWLAQTPQAFRRELYLRALERAQHDNFEGTDCASLVERLGIEVMLVNGELENFKVTFAADLERAQTILRMRQNKVK